MMTLAVSTLGGGLVKVAQRRVAAIDRELARQAQLLAGETKRQMVENRQVATGHTMQSVAGGVDVLGDGTRTLWVGGNETFRWVRLGRGPGKLPPVSAIEEWIRRKGLEVGRRAKMTPAETKRTIAQATALYKGRIGPLTPAKAAQELAAYERQVARLQRGKVRQTKDQAIHAAALSIAWGIAKRGTRRWRNEIGDPLAEALHQRTVPMLAALESAVRG